MIGERFQDALYLGGNPGFPVGTDAVPGCLALNDDNVAFEVGAAMSTRQYQTVVVLGVAGNSVGFLVGDASPIAV